MVTEARGGVALGAGGAGLREALPWERCAKERDGRRCHGDGGGQGPIAMATGCILGDGGVRDLLPWGQGVAVGAGGVGDALPWRQEAQAEALPGVVPPPGLEDTQGHTARCPGGTVTDGGDPMGGLTPPCQCPPRHARCSQPQDIQCGDSSPQGRCPHPPASRGRQTAPNTGGSQSPVSVLGTGPSPSLQSSPGLGRAGRTVLRGACGEPRPGSPGHAA